MGKKIVFKIVKTFSLFKRKRKLTNNVSILNDQQHVSLRNSDILSNSNKFNQSHKNFMRIH